MNSNVFYKNVKLIITNEGKNLFVKQSNGIKFASVGAVLFSDKNKAIKNAYENSKDNDFSILRNITLEQLKKYTTLIYNKIPYNYEGSIFIPTDYNLYNSALDNLNNLLPLQISYNNIKDTNEFEEIFVKDKTLSYNLILQPSTLNISHLSDMSFDGLAILGRPFKPIITESNLPIIQKQELSVLALVYFPDENEKIQILMNQPNNVAFNINMEFKTDKPIHLDGLKFLTFERLEHKNPKKFLFGLHLANDGLNNKG